MNNPPETPETPEPSDNEDNPSADAPDGPGKGEHEPNPQSSDKEDNAQMPSPSQDPDAKDKKDAASGIHGQQIRHRQLSARVPDNVGRGVFSTGAIVLTGNSEFVIDFLVRMARPFQVAARVVMPHGAMFQLIKALEENIKKHEDRFGGIQELPQGDPNAKRPSIEEVYDELKLPDELMSGTYANACILGHSPSEFVFDFVTNFFPRSAVSSRVYLSARQVPQMLKGLKHAAGQFEQRRKALLDQQQQQQQQMGFGTPPDNPPPPSAGPSGSGDDPGKIQGDDMGNDPHNDDDDDPQLMF